MKLLVSVGGGLTLWLFIHLLYPNNIDAFAVSESVEDFAQKHPKIGARFMGMEIPEGHWCDGFFGNFPCDYIIRMQVYAFDQMVISAERKLPSKNVYNLTDTEPFVRVATIDEENLKQLENKTSIFTIELDAWDEDAWLNPNDKVAGAYLNYTLKEIAVHTQDDTVYYVRMPCHYQTGCSYAIMKFMFFVGIEPLYRQKKL